MQRHTVAAFSFVLSGSVPLFPATNGAGGMLRGGAVWAGKIEAAQLNVMISHSRQQPQIHSTCEDFSSKLLFASFACCSGFPS